MPLRSPSLAARALLPTLGAACALVFAGCAAARPAGEPRAEELQQQLSAQAQLIAQQQQRLEQLEAHVAALASRQAAAPAPAAPGPPAPAQAPGVAGPGVPRSLQTVRLPAPAGGRRPRSPRMNPVERAPRLPAHVQLKDPDEGALAELETPVPQRWGRVDAGLRDAAGADHAFAEAVQKLNDGDYATAQLELLSFAARHPRHTAADNALYLAGLARAATGDCVNALPLFDRVPREYPAGDAVPSSLLEKVRCLVRLHRPEAGAAVAKLTREFPDAAETVQARWLLDGLEAGR